MNENLRQRLPIDEQYMMERSNRYFGLQRTQNNKAKPAELLDAVEPFVDVSENLLRVHRYRNPEDGLPQLDYTT
jgi:hypothetical protein